MGAAVRIKLDALERQADIYARDATVADQLRSKAGEYRSAAEAKGIEIPDVPPSIDDTEFYAESMDSLRFVEEVARGDDLAIAMHTTKDDEGTHGMHTQVSDADMVRGIAADAALALVTSAVAMASIFGWPVDGARVREIETDAKRISLSDHDLLPRLLETPPFDPERPAARRADQQLRPGVAGGGARRARSHAGSSVLVTHDEGAVEALSPERVLLLSDGVEDHWGPDYSDLVALA